jgi:tetratricopeptide (TPR) repeat protein
MFAPHKQPIVFILFLYCLITVLLPIAHAQDEAVDEKIVERYKQMLERKPKEGSTFDRLYQLYLEGQGLDQMVIDYQTEVGAKPENPNLQLILGHIYKRLGKNTEAIVAYKRAVDLASDNYYSYFALGQMYATLRRHEGAIAALTKAANLAIGSQSATPDELMATYKALGRAYFRRNRIDEAIAAWSKIAELDPQNIFSRIELADLFREQELYTQAIEQHEAIVGLKRDDPYRICLSLREIGKIQEEMGEYDAAVQNYDKALALTGQGNWLRKDLNQRIIGIYAHNGDWPGLITYYEGKLAQTPNDVELISLLANAYIENEAIDDGIAKYRQGLELAPTDAGLRLDLIAVFRNTERFEEAAAEYEILSEAQPDDFGIYRELGELYLQLDDENRAKATYQRMIDRDPENAGTYLNLAEIYTGHEWIDDAVAAYEKTISLAPENLDYVEYFGEFYFHQGNREKTVETWNRMVAGDRASAENYNRLAQLLDTKNFRGGAILASRKTVELVPSEYRYREALARRLMENKDYEEALAEYTEAAKLAPNPFFAEQMADQQIEIYRRQGILVEKIDELETAPETFEQQKQLAKMYLKLGNITYSIEVLLKAKTLKPDDVPINRWLAEIYVRQGRRYEANAIYTHLIEIDSVNAREYYGDIARSHLNVMDFDLAATAAKQVVAHSPRNIEGHQMLAEIAEQVGNYETAINSLKNAIRLRPEATNIRAEIAEIYKLSGSPRQAIEQYWQCWELSDGVEDKLTFVKSLSEAYYDLGRRGEFEEKLKQMSKANTSNMGSVLALAEIYQMEGDLPSARFQLARALDRERENPDLLEQLVEISLDLGDIQDALIYQQRLVKVQPDPVHQQRLGELLFDVGREQEAIQAWTKLLHAKNQTLEAEIKLAILLMRHGLLDEALSSLDRVGEKVKDAKTIYQIGATLIEMNELDRARPHFQRILEMPKPPENTTKNLIVQSSHLMYGPPGIDMHKFDFVQNLVWKIQSQPYEGRRGQSWMPNSFEEAQTGALVQLTIIAQQQRKLSEFIQQFETKADANPKDLQTLETLVKLYNLIENTDKARGIIDRLITASPNDAVYQGVRLSQLMRQNFDYETLKKYLDEMVRVAPEARLWYISQYASELYQQGRKAEVVKLLDEAASAKVTDLNTGSMLVSVYAQMGRTDAAEKIIAQLPMPVISAAPQTLITGTQSIAQQQWWRYSRIYRNLAAAYIREGKIDKGVALFWTFCDRTKPHTTNARRVAALTYSPHSYSGYTLIRFNYPSPTVYYNQDRLQYLQWGFNQLWMKDGQKALYTKLQAELETAEGRDRIYPGLALSYCYWWEGKRDKAQEILSALQREFPDDLTLKLNTVFASIQTGQHRTALELLDELAGVDPRNRRQYYNLTLQLASHIGDTVKVRELVTKVLNSPGEARELYQFSQKLQEGGFTQYASPIAKKAMALAMGRRDPYFLMELSEHLEDLGRGHEAARIAERAMRFANQRDRYGQTLYWRNYRQATHLISRSKAMREREPQLIKAAEKTPNSFQVQVQLATFYEGTNQLKKASAAFDAALALRPKDSMTRRRYAQMLQRSGQAADAVTQYMILLKENPNALGYDYREMIEGFFQAGKVDELVSLAMRMISPSIGQSFGNEFAENTAQECMKNNNPEAAIEIYEKIVEVQPKRYYTYDELASAYAAAGEPEKAIQLLHEKVETVDKPDAQVEIVSKLTELCKATSQIGGLVMEYEAKLVEKPEDPSLLYLVASMKIAANDIEGADTLVDQLLDLVSMNVKWLNNLATAYRDAGDRDRELRLLEATIEKHDPQDLWQLSESYQRLGAAYVQKGEKEKAQNTFRKMGAARILGGFNVWDKEHVATTYMEYEMWDDAEALFTEIINDFSVQQWNREQAQQQLAKIKRRRNGLAGTTQLTEKTQEINLGTQRSLAQQYMQRNQLKKAMEIYEQIATAMPEDLESRAQLATIYSRRNMHDKAIDTWKALLEVDSENTKYQDGIVNAYRSADKIPEALKLAQKYIDGEVDNSVHYIRLAKVYVAGDQVDDAIEAYKKAIALIPGDGQVYHELAQLYLRKDDLDAAEKTFEEAIQYIGQQWERQNIERRLMNLYHRQGKLEEMLKKAEDEGTLTFTMQRDRAQHYRSEGKLEKAVDAYKKALDMTSQSWDRRQIFSQLVQIYVQLGENDLAMKVYETLPPASPMSMISSLHSVSGVKALFDGDRVRETLINAYRNQGKLEQLKAHFEDRLEKERDNPAILEMIAEIYRDTNDYERAAQAYQVLCKAQPGNARSFYYAAATLNKSNQPDLAQELLNQGEVVLSASNHKLDIDFLAAMATICIDGEMYAPAIRFVEEAIAIIKSGKFGVMSGGGDPVLYGILGKSYLGTQQYENAVNAYQQMANVAYTDNQRKRAEKVMRWAYKAGKLYEKQIPEKLQQVAENPDAPDAQLALAQAYEWGDQVDQAIAAYERAYELQPNSTVILEPLAKLYADADLQKAIVLYKRLIELTDMPSDRIQKRRVLIELYKKLREFDTAIAELRDFVGTATEESERDAALHSLWEIYDDQGRETERITIFEELASQIGEDTTVYELLGDAYKEVGNQEKAGIAYTQWGELRQKEMNRQQRHSWEYGQFASQLLSKEIMPEKALELVLRVSRQEPTPNHTSILAWAYLVNGQPEKVKAMIESESNTEARTGLVMLLADHYARSKQTDKIIPLLSKAAEETQHLESKALYIGGMIYHLHQAGETEKIAELVPGSFVREAESADTISRDFKIEKDSNASGGKLLQGLGDDVYDQEENVEKSDEVVTFDISVQQAGDYKIIARVLAPDRKTDSFFVKFDDREKFYAWDTIRSSMWRWQVLTVLPIAAEDGFFAPEGSGPIHFPLSAGEHQLKLKKGDSGTKIDVFVFYRLQ